jgi:hypothetical protein
LDDHQTAVGGRNWLLVVRRARAADREQVVAFASSTFDGWDYIPNAFEEWLDTPDGVMLVGAVGTAANGSPALDAAGQPLAPGRVVTVARVAQVGPGEAWLEGLRVDPAVRGLSVATDFQAAELHWAAAQPATIVRYATGERNEGSHRLGARHGFSVVAAFQTWRSGGGDPHDAASGFDAAVRRAASRRRRALLARLSAAGLVAAAADADRLWRWLAADALFAAGAGLYEHRGWAFGALERDAFRRHVAAGEVLVADDGAALAVLPAEVLPAEDASLHLALVAGRHDGLAVLIGHIRDAADGDSLRFRLAAAGLSTSDDEALESALVAVGFERRAFVLHILSRPLTGAPAPELDPATVLLGDEPVPLG